ncbi:ciliary microtubule-associated protein 3 [Brachyhypopomus gauderio]|uniref:ciliary microtubule-associated protein 3 n=1 Tax=Brachyhypopomus gauderio TaxID=698409 RepID=UPI0040429D7C
MQCVCVCVCVLVDHKSCIVTSIALFGIPPGYHRYCKQTEMAARNGAKAPAARIAFGSCQDRKLFPLHGPPNHAGNELRARRGSPARGPGCYDNHVVGTIISNLERRPQSTRGYSLAARSAPRFLPALQMDTPSPQKYQQDWSVPTSCAPARTPFSSSAPRFRSESDPGRSNPGPGTYSPDASCGRKVSWPMRFGSPDWSRVPMLERRALRTELLCDKQFRTQRNRTAYLRLFYH